MIVSSFFTWQSVAWFTSSSLKVRREGELLQVLRVQAKKHRVLLEFFPEERTFQARISLPDVVEKLLNVKAGQHQAFSIFEVEVAPSELIGLIELRSLVKLKNKYIYTGG